MQKMNELEMDHWFARGIACELSQDTLCREIEDHERIAAGDYDDTWQPWHIEMVETHLRRLWLALDYKLRGVE